MSSPNPSPKGRAPVRAAGGNRGTGESLGRSLVWSGTFHIFLAAMFVISAVFSHRGAMWGGGGGGGGGAVQVTLVGGIAGIPMPKPEIVTPSRVADTTRGLYKSEPPPKVPPFEPKATELPEFMKEKRPKYQTPRPSKLLENPTPPPQNAIPYGQGGAPTVPYSFNVSGNTQGGMSMGGPAGGFGQRFPWYVQAVQRRISSNWLQATVDPTVQWAPRSVIDFEILRDGTIANVYLKQSSGYASVDASAIRAIHASSPLNPLPGDYQGNYVSVEFYFDFRR